MLKYYLIALASIVIILLILFLIIYLINIKVRKTYILKRYDDNGTLHYFSEKDHPGLEKEIVHFKSGKETLCGYFYHYKDVETKAVLVLSHGLGAGHIQYTTEIAHFAKQGYLVFTYDVRGCLNSSGKAVGYMENALLDLDDALTYIETKEELKKYKVFLFGHSMGGYCVNNITYFNHRVDAVISLAGFNSSLMLNNDFISLGLEGKGKFPSFCVNFIEKIRFPKLSKLTTVESLKKIDIPYLLVSGDKDPIVKPSSNFDLYVSQLSDKKNIKFLNVKNRYHRPNISLDAAEYDVEVSNKINTFFASEEKTNPNKMKELYDSFDYNLLVEFDKEVMSEIDDFYKQNL